MKDTRLILLAYASRYGSTQEVAETIAAALRAARLEVHIQPVGEVKTVDPYDAVVLGAAIYNSLWHPDAHQFLTQHEGTLRQRPVAIFALGPLTTGRGAFISSRRQLDRELGKYPWLKPIALEMFAGKLDPAKYGLFARLLSPASNHRNREAIRTWANVLAGQLQQEKMLRPA